MEYYGAKGGRPMHVQESVRKMTLTILVGEVLLTGIMLVVFACLGRFDVSVLLGALLGACFAVLNFFLMGLSVQKAAEQMQGAQLPAEEDDGEADEIQADKPLSPQAQEAKKKMQLSYGGRMLMMVGVAVLGLVLPCFHPLAVVIPMLFPRLVIMIQGFVMKQKEA